MTRTLEGTHNVGTVGVFVAWIVVTVTLVNVFVTVAPREPSRTVFTAGCGIADGVTVTTVAVTLTVLAPLATQTRCNNGYIVGSTLVISLVVQYQYQVRY
ncbi:hypothetical protein NP493_242g00003 [Ridgeia piscesae]|uniref:Transmembrane protein n=1 Tax=Ridgeia piscesae TaxID=27915 RepID=A0AAD9UD27_RIDPI|nr:hypothetical protein NP493_242g00003 [Ridgeia piscesae]